MHINAFINKRKGCLRMTSNYYQRKKSNWLLIAFLDAHYNLFIEFNKMISHNCCHSIATTVLHETIYELIFSHITTWKTETLNAISKSR